jgi:AcrR family transcriptional regulator
VSTKGNRPADEDRASRPGGGAKADGGSPPSLRERILDRALERFNAEGIEYVGVRELAKDLGIQGGHITYYFPTKDDLVAAIGSQLRELNDATIRIPRRPSLLAYLRMFRQAFRNHHRFRCLFMSMPHLMQQNATLAATYVGTVEKGRRRVIADYLTALRAEGVFRADLTDAEIERIVGFLALATRGWIGDASISFRDRTPEWCMAYYLQIVADHLRGFATEKGRRQLASFEAELEG